MEAESKFPSKIVDMEMNACFFYILFVLCRVVELTTSASYPNGAEASFWVAKIRRGGKILEHCTAVLIGTTADTLVTSPKCFILVPNWGKQRYESMFPASIFFFEFTANGTTGRKIGYKPNEIIIHPDYYHGTQEYNLAVLKLERMVSEIKPAMLSPYNLTDVDECSLLALSLVPGSKVDPDFVMLSLPGLEIGNETSNIQWQAFNLPSDKDFFARFSSPLMCRKNDQWYVQGFFQGTNSDQHYGDHQIMFDNNSTLYFVDVAATYNWIINPE